MTRIILLAGTGQAEAIRFLSDRVDARQLAAGQRIVVTITRTGTFTDPRYGTFEISRAMLEQMVRNFDGRVYGQDIALDVAHEPEKGAAGWFRRLFLDGNKLRGEVELTAMGVEAITQRGFRYLSAEFVENYTDNESGQAFGPTLLGAGLVVRPAIKRLDPIELSEASLGDRRVLLSDRITRILSEEFSMNLKELMEKLANKLGSYKLAEAVIAQLLGAFEEVAKKLGEDKAALDAVFSQFDAAGKALAEAQPGQPVALNIQLGEQAIDQLVAKKLAEFQAQQQAQAKQLAEKQAALVKIFTDAIDAQQGFSDELKKELREAADIIGPEWTEEAVRKLAERQIKFGEQLSARFQLAQMGYNVGGNVQITIDDSNTAKALQEQILKNLRGTALHAAGRLQLSEKTSPFVEKVLAEFDRLNAERIHAEHKLLSGGTTGISDTQLPVGVQRTVIREALSDLRVLELVQQLTDFTAQGTTQIPYEERDTSDVRNDGIVFEGQGIHRASIAQKMDLAYVLPMKLAFIISNEVMHFSRASAINWDAYARNVESNARVLRELVVRRICNEMLRAADSYLAVDVKNEDISAQLDGSTSEIKLNHFPIVRPFQQYDMAGNAVGSVRNPITVRLDGVEVPPYDGTGTQQAGTYYRVTSYNLGKIQFVNQAGTPVTPASSAGADDVSYSRVTNVVKFDLDVPAGSTLEQHLNGLLRAIGARKAMMNADRYVLPDFLLMSPVLNDICTNAEQFAAQAKRDGSDTNGQGDLVSVKGIPAWGTNAPNIDLGDERILMGQRGTLSYTIAKPFMTGAPFEAVDAKGRPTGQKQAYGEEYNAIKVPDPIRNRLTSVLAYSASGR